MKALILSRTKVPMLPESAPLTESVAALTNYFVGDATLGETLSWIADSTTRALPQANLVGITMKVDGKLGTFAFNHPDVPDIDREQYSSGDGPCVHAFTSGETVVIPSTQSSTKWPAFCKVAAQHGVMSTLSVPMMTTHAVVGALNLYADSEEAFTARDAGDARIYATQAGFLLANAQAFWDARSLSENLRAAMASRAEIEQAKGIIIAATGCTADEAFEKLRIQSQHENVKLRDIAIRIVANAQRPR